MSTTVRVTYEHFEEMICRGELSAADERYEPISGEICPMPWPDPPHESVVARVNARSCRSVPEDEVEVRVQSTLGIPALDSMTLPDVAWVRARSDFEQRPGPEDVLLVVEVADSSVWKDRNQKGKLYAQAGIADYWIANIPDRCLEIRRDPVGDAYQTVLVLRPGEEARPLAFPDLALPVARLFPEG